MSLSSDVWYVRLPDGRILRASSTSVLRHQLEIGRLPLNCRVRRRADDEWVSLGWTEEFSDLLHKARPVPEEGSPKPKPREKAASPPEGGVSLRLDPARLPMVGIRHLLNELLAAMDCSLVKPKTWIGCTTGVLAGIVLAFASIPSPPVFSRVNLTHLLVVGFLLLIGTVGTALLSRLTYLELIRLEPVGWQEAKVGLFRLVARLLPAYLLTAGVPLLAIWVLRQVPSWVPNQGMAEGLSGIGILGKEGFFLLAFLLEVVLWLILSFALLVGPVIVVEETSTMGALREWWRLLREQIDQVLLYETLAMALAVLAALPIFIPLILALTGPLVSRELPPGTEVGLLIIGGAACGPLIAYLGVANVFIYLNLRYEQASPRTGRVKGG